MDSRFLTLQGHLKSDFHPAVYFDSSVAIDYMRSSNLEPEPDQDIARIIDANENQGLELLGSLLGQQEKLKKVYQIRNKLEKSNTFAVLSSLGLLEIHEWLVAHSSAVG